MTAVFPNGIASFTPKKDGADINYATDINRLQEELVAVQTTLGALLTTVRDDETQSTFNFGALGLLLSFMIDSAFTPALALSGSNQVIQPITDTAKFQRTKPTAIKLDSPPAYQDAFNLYNGTGITLNKGGFWLLTGSVRFDVGDPKATNGKHDLHSDLNAGIYQAAIDVGGDWTIGMDRKSVVDDSNYWPNVFLNPVRMGWLPKGTKVTLRASQSSGQNQRMAAATLSAVRVRGDSAIGPGGTVISIGSGQINT